MRLYEIDGKLRDKLKKIHHLYIAYSFLVEIDLQKASELDDLLNKSINEIYPTIHDDINRDLEKWREDAKSVLFRILKK
jgi:hypothetical protein